MGNLIRIPGPLDPHTHLRDLDWSHKATFASETAAAVAGGYTAVFEMPNTAPSTIDRASLDRKIASLDAGALCDWGVYFGASQADNSTLFRGVAPETCGLKMFCNATTGDLLIEDQGLRERHFRAWPASRLIAVHAEGQTVVDILKLVRLTGKRTHFLHISTAEEIGFLRAARAEGLPITIGACPHHLFLTEMDLPRLGGFGMMKPDLKTAKDRDALWAALADGLVDVVESDHAPHTLAEKTSAKPPYGVPGLETTIPLMLTAAVDGRLPLERVIDLISTNPRKIWGLPCPAETFATVDLDARYALTGKNQHGACKWTPFEGMPVRGRVIETVIRGSRVFDGEQVLARPGAGRNVFGGPAAGQIARAS